MSMTVDGRPMTNMEMYNDIQAMKEAKWKMIERHGCCLETDERNQHGQCWGVGICPAVLEAIRLMGGLRKW